MKKSKNAKATIAIVGTVVSGHSYDDWYGRCVGSATVLKELAGTGDVEVYINSQGGSVFAGFEILNALNAAVVVGRKVDIYISPLAASIASYISTGVKGATVYASANAKLMYHAPWAYAGGSKDELRDQANLLEKMEVDLKAAIESRGCEVEDEWFAAGRMKWFNAKEALAKNLVDVIKDPPAELLTAISEASAGFDDYDDSDRGDSPENDAKTDMLRIAANMEFAGFIESQCTDHYGAKEGDEPCNQVAGVTNVTKEAFEIVFADGSKSLLNYQRDPLNIVNIEWDSCSPINSKENEMTAEQIAALKAEEAKAKLEANEAKAALVVSEAALVKANTEADTAKAALVTANAEAAEKRASLEANQLPEGFTAEMVAWAQTNFAEAKSANVAKILAREDNTFTEEDLNAFSVDNLGKMAILAVVPGTAPEPKVDNSLTPDGTNGIVGGSLPPPGA